MKRNITIVICLIAGLLSGTTLGFFLIYPSLQQAETNRDYWHNEYNDLTQDYNDLLDDFNDLFADYEALKEAFEEPLTSPVVPTFNEFNNWLWYVDDTESYSYTGVWKCGDFAAMLMVNAKAMNWRMRIACMFWSEEFGSGWQDPTDPYGEYGHAFNVILCQDYNGDSIDDWFYIEPQTDKVWYVVIGSTPYIHYDIWLTFGGGISGTVWGEPYYINHYSYFA